MIKKNVYLIFLPLLLILVSARFAMRELPYDESTLFTGSGNCILCHSSDGKVLTAKDGRDVSPIKHWQSSMMANAAIDPLWRAKVAAEVNENPHLKTVIEDKCLTCHAPMGRTEAIHNGKAAYSMAEMKADPLALDGVSCALCHQIQDQDLGEQNSFTGGYTVDDSKQMFGPYSNPFINSMLNNTGYSPKHSNHLGSSEMCAICHTLITPFVDGNGKIVGEFPEQVPYFEWKNSAFSQEKIQCQDCHMPENKNDFVIAARPPWLSTLRNPIYEHHLVGGNVTMNQLLNQNATELGVNAGAANLDTTALLSEHNLKNKSLEVVLRPYEKEDKTGLEVEIINKTGHKFPTGFPSRRMWLHVTAKSKSGEILFESGAYNKMGALEFEEDFQQHHELITNETQTQIYETVMLNTDNEITHTLLRAANYKKDNRIPPLGFVSNQSYDSLIIIAGAATADVDFNKSDELQGTGADKIYYEIDFDAVSTWEVELCYQTLAYPFYKHLSTTSTDEMEMFKDMYAKESVPKVQVMYKGQALADNLKTGTNKVSDLKVFPNPVKENTVLQFETTKKQDVTISFYDLSGALISRYASKKLSAGNHEFKLSEICECCQRLSEVVLLSIESNNQKVQSRLLQL